MSDEETEYNTQDFKGNKILEFLDKGDFQIKLIDFSNSCWIGKKFSEVIAKRTNRPPEIVLGMSYNEKVDIWACGCSLYKLFTGEDLFFPESDGFFSKDEDHLAQIIEVVHEYDPNFINSASRKKVIFIKF